VPVLGDKRVTVKGVWLFSVLHVHSSLSYVMPHEMHIALRETLPCAKHAVGIIIDECGDSVKWSCNEELVGSTHKDLVMLSPEVKRIQKC